MRQAHFNYLGGYRSGVSDPQLRLHLEKIPPGQLLVRRGPQQIGRVQRRHGRNGDAGRRGMDAPVAAQPQDAFGRVEQGLGRWAAEIDQHLRIDQLDLPLDERAADLGLVRRRRAVARRPPRDDVGDIGRSAGRARSPPACGRAAGPSGRRRAGPRCPRRGPAPRRPASASASGLPSAKTRFLAVNLRLQPSKAAMCWRSSSSVDAVAASCRASAACASSGTVAVRRQARALVARPANGSCPAVTALTVVAVPRFRALAPAAVGARSAGFGAASANRFTGASSSASSTPAWHRRRAGRRGRICCWGRRQSCRHIRPPGSNLQVDDWKCGDSDSP